MKNLLILALAAPLALVGCNSSDNGGGGGGSFNKTPSLQISNENREVIDEFAIGGVVGLESGYADFLFDDDWGDFSVNISKHAARLMDRQPISGRNISESFKYDCDTGSEEFSVTGSGISEEGDISANGNLTIEMKSNNCVEEFGGYRDVSNGTMRFTISWTGYNDGSNTFSSLNFTIRAINSSWYEYFDGDLEYFEEFDGELSSSLSGVNYTNTLDMFFRGTDLDGEGVKVETLTNITGSIEDERPTAGQWIVRGGGGTTARYTIVPNGIEVSVNDGQAELITWAEIDANYGSDGWDDW